jgi:polar amino acid transport system substrate-binding protein
MSCYSFTRQIKLRFIRIVLILGCSMGQVHAETQQIEVGLEPAPPLITEEGKGLFVDVLHSIEKQLGVHFHINMVTFSRAKHDLVAGRLQMIGFTTFRSEGAEFYSKANELDWSINAALDIYTMDDRHLDLAQLQRTGVIGTPIGDEEAMSSMLNIPKSRLYSTHLKNLVLMLKSGRIDALIFERASTMTTINELGISGIRYQKIHDGPGGLALHKEPSLDKLKPRLEKALMVASKQRELKHFYNLPDKGVVALDPSPR